MLPEDLISADGMCPGMAPPSADANALTDANAPRAADADRRGGRSVTPNATSRAASALPDNVSLSNNQRGDRVATLTYSRGAARRHLHLHRGPPDLDRACARAAGGAEGRQAEEARRDDRRCIV